MSAFVSRTLRIGALALVLPLLSGCANYIFNRFDIDGSNDSLSIDAKQRVILSTREGGRSRDRKIVCAEPSPDALSATAASAGGSGAIAFPTLLPAAAAADQKQGTTNAGFGAAAGRSESVASIAMRTQTIQLLRDGLYRACEAYMNGAIDQHQYNIVLLNIDRLMVTLLGVDGIAGTHVVPPVSVSANPPAIDTKATVPGGNTEGNADVKPGSPIEYKPSYIVQTTAPGAVQSEAIANVILTINSGTSIPSLCISLLASGELRLDNPGQHSVLKNCDYVLNGALQKYVKAPIRAPREHYYVSKNASQAQQPAKTCPGDKPNC